MDICEDLIVEHEGEALLDGGLVGQPVIEQVYLNDCLLLSGVGVAPMSSARRYSPT